MDDDEIAMEFAADVEDAVASIRDLAASAQDLAGTAAEAQGGLEELTGATQGLADDIYEAGAAAAESAGEISAWTDEQRSAAAAAADLAAAEGALKAATADAKAAVADLAATQATAGKDSTEYATQLDAVAAAMDRQATAAAQLKAAQEGGAEAAESSAAAQGAAADAADATTAKNDEAAASAAGMGSSLKMAGLAAAVGIGVATDEAVKFQAETTRLVTSAGESAANLNQVRQGMLGISAATDTSTEQMASGMYTIESAGFHGANGLVVLKAAAQGAKDEGAELSTVANGVTDALVDFHEPASDAANVTSQLIAGVSKGKTTFEEFSGSMSNILPLASSLHLKLADVTGVLAEMTAHGMSAQRASEDEANAMRSLMNPTATMSAEYAKLGTSSKAVQESLGTRGLAGTMQWLSGIAQQGATGIGQTYTQALIKLMGTAPGAQVALATTGENANATSAAIKGISSATADASGNVDGFSTVSQTAAFKLGAAGESAKAAGISLGEVFVPAVTDALGPVTSFLQLVASNRDASIAFALVVGTILATAIGVKLAGALKDAKEGVTAAGEGIEWLVGKLTGASAAGEASAAATDAQTAATEALTAAKEESVGATEAATVAQGELDVAMDANPIGLIVLAVAALIAVIVLLVTHTHEVAHVFDVMRHDVAAGVDWLVSFVESHWKLLATILLTALLGPLGFLVAMFITHFDQVKAVISDVISWVASHWKEIVAWLVDPVGMAVFEIRSHTHEISEAFDDCRHAIAATVDGMGHDIESGFDSLRHDAAAAADGLVKDVETSFDQQRHDVAAFADWLPTEIEHGFDDARHNAAAAWDGLVHDVESAFDDARHDVSAGVDDIVSFFEKLPGEALHELAALPGQMEHAGEDVVNGLLHGVEDMAGQLLQQVEGLAHDVEKAFTDPLSILSPSRVMAGHGADYVNGIISGVQSRAQALTDTVHGLSAGLAAPGAAVPAGSAVTHDFNVNVTGQGGQPGNPYQGPEFEQFMQSTVQEAILRYAEVNPSNGLTPAWGR